MEQQSERGLSAGLAFAIAIAGGGAVWLATAFASGNDEAWDSLLYWTLYWTAGYPAAVVLAGILGFFAPVKPWRWALAVMLIQAVALTVMVGDFGLMPLGMLVFTGLAVPAAGIAMFGAFLRRRMDGA